MIKDFKLELGNLDSLNELLKMQLTNGAVRVNAVKWKERRGLSQNSLLWLWLNYIADNVPVSDKKHSADVWHEYFKNYFCPVKFMAMPAGDDLQMKSTALLDVGEFCHYLNRIEQWAQSHMINLPIPPNSEYESLNDLQNT